MMTRANSIHTPVAATTLVLTLLLTGGPALCHGADTPNADIVVVLDLSGSMGTADDEDNNNRFSAFFTWTGSFTLPGDRIAVVTMGNGSKLISSLQPKAQFSFADHAGKLKRRARYTDVASGLENAYYQLKTNGRPDAVKLILMLSDAQIDMPRGMWDLENSMRYLHDSLIPSMKKENITLVSIVPDGLKANFPLLQELSDGTGGVYYRGLPGDVVAVRRQHIRPLTATVALSKKETPAVSQVASAAEKSVKSPDSVSDTVPAKLKSEKPATQSAQADNGMRLEFIVLGGILFLGFTLIFGAIMVLFKRTSVRPASDDEIADVLEEVQALKSEANQTERLATQLESDMADDDDPDFGEPRERLSVSMVSPFLDYEEAKAVVRKRPTDEIAVKPVFSDDPAEEANLSVSTMETLIGTASPMVDDK
jgi:hypothetical protein